MFPLFRCPRFSDVHYSDPHYTRRLNTREIEFCNQMIPPFENLTSIKMVTWLHRPENKKQCHLVTWIVRPFKNLTKISNFEGWKEVGLQMCMILNGSEIQKPNHQKSGQDGHHFVKKHLESRQKLWISNGCDYSYSHSWSPTIWKPDQSKSDLQKVSTVSGIWMFPVFGWPLDLLRMS